MSDYENGLHDGQALMLHRVIRILKSHKQQTAPNSGAGRELKDLLRIINDMEITPKSEESKDA